MTEISACNAFTEQVDMHVTQFFLRLHHRLLQYPWQLQLVNFRSHGYSVGICAYPCTQCPSIVNGAQRHALYKDPGSIGRHGVNAVQLYTLLDVESGLISSAAAFNENTMYYFGIR